MLDDKLAQTGDWLLGGEIIVIQASEKSSNIFEFPLSVVLEGDYLAIIEKPAGILVSGNKFRTIQNALPPNLRESTVADACAPQPIHRLDYATSGLLLVGKTHSSIRALNQLFAEKLIQKTYWAITIGEMHRTGTIDLPVDTKDAITDYKVLETMPSDRFGKLNLVALYPSTGRRHQIRKHLSGIGNPVLGDKLYGVEGSILKGKGMYLHAAGLKFKHPFTQEIIELKTDLPKRFRKIFPK
ncbi:MAG: RluA family pseudouridine synthase [Flavobacteriaceae bacterium]|nr:RluA family pseudouridine synthase [Flavobacteriaceae bacterium]